MSKDKKQNIKNAIEIIEKQFGKEAVMLLGSKSLLNIEVFSSGSFVIDDLLGIGGYPKGRILELYGPESSGKTTIALHAVAEVQKAGGIAAFIDAEHAIDPNYASELGVNVDDLILSQPDSGEQALEIVDTLAKTGCIDLIVVDSVAALAPEAELNGEMKDQVLGGQARLMSRALRKITATLGRKKTTVIFVNQIREKIGIIFGNPEVTPGGRALKFFSSIRIEVRRMAAIKIGDTITGNNIKVKIVKNKLAAPFKIGVTEITFAKGISKESEIISIAENKGIVIKKGSWYQFGGKNIAQGKQNFKKELETHPELFKTIIEEIAKKSSN